MELDNIETIKRVVEIGAGVAHRARAGDQAGGEEPHARRRSAQRRGLPATARHPAPQGKHFSPAIERFIESCGAERDGDPRSVVLAAGARGGGHARAEDRGGAGAAPTSQADAPGRAAHALRGRRGPASDRPAARSTASGSTRSAPCERPDGRGRRSTCPACTSTRRPAARPSARDDLRLVPGAVRACAPGRLDYRTHIVPPSRAGRHGRRRRTGRRHLRRRRRLGHRLHPRRRAVARLWLAGFERRRRASPTNVGARARSAASPASSSSTVPPMRRRAPAARS